MKIEKLTAAQSAIMAEYAKRWTEIGLSTTPADRPRAEAAIIEMYRAAGLPAPRSLIRAIRAKSRATSSIPRRNIIPLTLELNCATALQ